MTEYTLTLILRDGRGITKVRLTKLQETRLRENALLGPLLDLHNHMMGDDASDDHEILRP